MILEDSETFSSLPRHEIFLNGLKEKGITDKVTYISQLMNRFGIGKKKANAFYAAWVKKNK